MSDEISVEEFNLQNARCIISEQRKRIAELEECIMDGLTATTATAVNAWFKQAAALLQKGTK